MPPKEKRARLDSPPGSSKDQDSSKDEIESCIRDELCKVFPETPKETFENFKLKSYKGGNYNFHCGSLLKALKLPIDEVACRIKEKFPPQTSFYKGIVVCDNSNVNVYVKNSPPEKCTCDLEGNVGPQNIELTSNGSDLRELLLSLLIKKLSFNEEIDSLTIKKIIDNLKFHMGGGEEIKDIMEAVKRVFNRDYPGINDEHFATIFVPKLFFSNIPKDIDLDQSLEEVKNQMADTHKIPGEDISKKEMI